jgi:predicted lysophospholipase L1 biosynthesis ABC-type transport system permease subunit
MKNLSLYFKYAWRSIQRGGQRSFFAILCIAVGVAAIVALQTTGLAIQDSVAGDARANAQADVLVTSRLGNFTEADLTKIDKLKQDGTILDFTTSNSNNGLVVKKPDGSNSNSFGSYYISYIVDPAKFPLYGKIELAEPKGKTLKEVLTGPNQVIIDNKMATSVGAKLGDTINASNNGNKLPLKVAGIISNNTPAPGTGQAAFTGYDYITMDTAKNIFKPEELLADTIYVKTTNSPSVSTGLDNKARDAIKALSQTFDAETSTERNEQVKQASKGLSDVLQYVGLLSLLIGSVGVVNTMLVVVGRRSTEIATIKALGMESSQTVQVFVIEAAILGLIGSVVGVVLGEGLSLIMSQVAQGFVGQNLNYNFYWQPVGIGLVTGIVTAIVFGLLPAYSASKIPPAQVLRQKTNALPRISIIATLLIILVMTLVMGALAGVILGGQFQLGIIVAFATLVACSVLVFIFSGLLWLVGKLPLPFGLNYKMARRNLSRGRAKSATTLLVMMVGIFSVALVIILASSLKDTIKEALEKSFGYNIQYSVKDDAQTVAVRNAFDNNQLAGLQKYVNISQTNARLVSGGGATVEQLIERKRQKEAAANQGQYQGQSFDLALISGFDAKDLPSLAKLTEGQFYAADDQAVISKEVRDNYGLKIGDQLIYQPLAGSNQITLTVVGVYESKNFLVDLGPVATTYSRLQTITPHLNVFELTVDKGKTQDAVNYLQTNFPGSNATDLSIVTSIIDKLIDNVTAFPILLALLSLIAGAVLIANNVALAVLERRTEMGVMKSIGADDSRVLAIINWESAIVGLLGGLIGLGLASTAASLLIQTFSTPDNPAVLSISPVVSLGMIGLALGLALVATTSSAWGAAHEKPLVVLRYE